MFEDNDSKFLVFKRDKIFSLASNKSNEFHRDLILKYAMSLDYRDEIYLDRFEIRKMHYLALLHEIICQCGEAIMLDIEGSNHKRKFHEAMLFLPHNLDISVYNNIMNKKDYLSKFNNLEIISMNEIDGKHDDYEIDFGTENSEEKLNRLKEKVNIIGKDIGSIR